MSLDGDVSWHRHWVWGELLWGSGVAKLRGGVEGGNDADVWAGVALCKRYFAAVRSRGHPLHFVSSRAAEAYACLEALALAASNGGHLDKAGAAAAAAVQLCAAYVPALEHEYGDADAHNVRMRAFCRGHCGRCGSFQPMLALQACGLLQRGMPEGGVEGAQGQLRPAVARIKQPKTTNNTTFLFD